MNLQLKTAHPNSLGAYNRDVILWKNCSVWDQEGLDLRRSFSLQGMKGVSLKVWFSNPPPHLRTKLMTEMTHNECNSRINERYRGGGGKSQNER